ncbi:hypothetical protein [Tenacibaculum sp. C7A-26P2]|uniref:hypothetical protein n=1 Tax=Tenacibaculum sp. C7A-26P2 TaxID=3447504 RepID=UPI003F83BCE3
MNTSNTQLGICFSGSMCNSQNNNISNCTNYNSNCQVVNEGSVSYTYTDTCTFDWDVYTSSYTDANGWNTYSNFSGTQYRSVSCKDEDNNYASHDKCDSNTKPTSSQAYTAFRWINDDYYSGCTAKYNDLHFSQNKQETNPLTFILYSGVADAKDIYHQMIAPVDGTYTVYGTEYKKAYCYKLMNTHKPK